MEKPVSLPGVSTAANNPETNHNQLTVASLVILVSHSQSFFFSG